LCMPLNIPGICSENIFMKAHDYWVSIRAENG